MPVAELHVHAPPPAAEELLTAHEVTLRGIRAKSGVALRVRNNRTKEPQVDMEVAAVEVWDRASSMFKFRSFIEVDFDGSRLVSQIIKSSSGCIKTL